MARFATMLDTEPYEILVIGDARSWDQAELLPNGDWRVGRGCLPNGRPEESRVVDASELTIRQGSSELNIGKLAKHLSS